MMLPAHNEKAVQLASRLLGVSIPGLFGRDPAASHTAKVTWEEHVHELAIGSTGTHLLNLG